MRLSVKMILIFSVMMIIAVMILSSYTVAITRDGSNAFTEARFNNIAENIHQNLGNDFGTMQWTMQELSKNSVLLTALNQLVRDDSEEQNQALSAGRTALIQLKRSPLVNTCDRVSFYTRDGIFLTWPALIDDDVPQPGYSNRMPELIDSYDWLDAADTAEGPYILVPHRSFLSAPEQEIVYGLVQAVRYSGKVIGYLEVGLKYENLEHLMQYADEENILLQITLDDGRLLYSSTPDRLSWPGDMEQNRFVLVSPENTETQYNACSIHLDDFGMGMVIAQDSANVVMMRQMLRHSILKRAFWILLPALVIIALVAFRLTRSIRKLTRKVQNIPTGSVLTAGGQELSDLRKNVTSPTDRETYELENVFNQMMHQLREQANTEMSLREGTLQAQLSALQTQINPHFIYNTLNIISAKSMESGNYDVIEICDRFASMLRYSTDTRSRTATLADEIDNVRNYLMLAKARYEENLVYTIDVPENLNEITVPKLTLQPLVENALTHGFNGMNIQRILSVTGSVRGDSLVLEIRDNGVGFSEEMLRSLRGQIREIEDGRMSVESAEGHIGLVNTCLRLYYYSKGTMHVAVGNDGGAVITMTFPAAGNAKK